VTTSYSRLCLGELKCSIVNSENIIFNLIKMTKMEMICEMICKGVTPHSLLFLEFVSSEHWSTVLIFIVFFVLVFVFCFRPVSCVPRVASFSGLSILYLLLRFSLMFIVFFCFGFPCTVGFAPITGLHKP
jgi:hypothetical protein